MINLLPPEEKQNLRIERKWKTVLILGVVGFVFFVSLILVLIAINFSVAAQLKSQDIILNNKKNESNVSDLQNVKNEVTQANQIISQTASFYDQTVSMTGFLQEISGLLPKGIYLSGISVNPLGSGKNFQVVLSGHASSIDDVVALNDDLKNDENLNQISFPDETWLQKSDFNFNVSFQATLSE